MQRPCSCRVISPANTDMVRWVQTNGAWMPQPLTRFGPTPVENETLTPNKETVVSNGAGRGVCLGR